MQPLTAWQSAFEPLLTPGAYNCWKSHNFVDLGDGLLDGYGVYFINCAFMRAYQNTAAR